MAFFPSSSTLPGILGEMYSAAFTGAAFNWICSPAVTELETIVLDWLAKMLALPEIYHSTGPTYGGGVIHGTASEAILTVMVAARDKYLREATAHIPDEGEREEAVANMRGSLVALGSSATHSSTKKAAMIAGVRFVAIPVGQETNYSLTGTALTEAIEQCRSRGLKPFYITATMGTTDMCAVDDFPSIATALSDLQSRHRGEVWVHVDAAYAGAALVCEQYQHYTSVFHQFHSFNVNMHKWMLVNFDCSCLFVKDRRHLTEAFSILPPYLRNQFSDSGLVTDYRDWGIPLGRRFRSLKVWFVLRSYGVEGLRAHIERGISLGERFAELIRGRSDLFEILTGPRFSLTVFTHRGRRADATVEEQNALTRTMYKCVNDGAEIYITSTLIGQRFAIRILASTATTRLEHVQKAFEILVRAGEAAIRELGATGNIEFK